jgi:hypothetical protein
MGLNSAVYEGSINEDETYIEGPEDSLQYTPPGLLNSTRKLNSPPASFPPASLNSTRRSTRSLSRSHSMPILKNTPDDYWPEKSSTERSPHSLIKEKESSSAKESSSVKKFSSVKESSTVKESSSVNGSLFQAVTRNGRGRNNNKLVSDPLPFSQISDFPAVVDIYIPEEDDSVQRMEDSISHLHSMQDTEMLSDNAIEKLNTTTAGCGISGSINKQTSIDQKGEAIDQKGEDNKDITVTIDEELSLSVLADKRIDYIPSTDMLPSDLKSLPPPPLVYQTLTALDCGEKVSPLLAELSKLPVDVISVILKCIVKKEACIQLCVLDGAIDLCEIFMRKAESKRSVKSSKTKNLKISGNRIPSGKKDSSKIKSKEYKNTFMSQALKVIKALQKLTNNKEHRLGGDLSVAQTVSSSSLLLVYLLLEVQWITEKGIYICIYICIYIYLYRFW